MFDILDLKYLRWTLVMPVKCAFMLVLSAHQRYTDAGSEWINTTPA